MSCGGSGRRPLEADPPGHEAWFGYAELCLFLGHDDDYRQARRDLLRRFGATSDPYIAERVARACLLLPASDDDVQAASALVKRALAARETTDQWIYPYFLFAQGLAESRRGHLDDAITIMQSRAAEVMGPCPRLVIAMAQYRKGDIEKARKTLAAEVVHFDWSMGRVLGRDDWIWHVLRREAENTIMPDWGALVEGRHEPKDNIERLALLGICRFKDLNRASAKLYADAFSADPKLADDPEVGHRYNAALAAALAGCGLGADVQDLSEAERAHWRQLARQWIAQGLAATRRGKPDASAKTGVQVQRAFARWRANGDLSRLREPGALDKLPPAERRECRTLLSDIDALFERAQEGK
jgi:hypothetical protein